MLVRQFIQSHFRNAARAGRQWRVSFLRSHRRVNVNEHESSSSGSIVFYSFSICRPRTDCDERCEHLFAAYRGLCRHSLYQCACGCVYNSETQCNYNWCERLDELNLSEGKVDRRWRLGEMEFTLGTSTRKGGIHHRSSPVQKPFASGSAARISGVCSKTFKQRGNFLNHASMCRPCVHCSRTMVCNFARHERTCVNH